MTKASATALAGLGLMGVAKDTYPHDGETHSYVVGFAEVEVDVETGVVRLIEYTAVADVGTVINPRSLGGQILGGSCLGIGHALCQRSVYDQQYGVALARRFHHTKPLTIMDIPATGMHQAALDLADPDTPVGARGVGEPPVGAGYRRGAGGDCRRGRRRRVPARSGDARPDPHLARGRPARARRAHVAYLARGWLGLRVSRARAGEKIR